ncbi:MAG: hypothetical protein DID91_2727702837 [Candidatus Nitrotoga sp. MKT]|nr:MAG: hypothetical protein DID91_2727702837 [Candidatus Nitrotoga sp. MKT]
MCYAIADAPTSLATQVPNKYLHAIHDTSTHLHLNTENIFNPASTLNLARLISFYTFINGLTPLILLANLTEQVTDRRFFFVLLKTLNFIDINCALVDTLIYRLI